jgi:hypothetical protein
VSKTTQQAKADEFGCFCAEQIMRLSVFRDSFPFEDEGRRELGMQIKRLAKSEEHARRIIDAAITEQRCPTPARLNAIAEDLPASGKGIPLPAGCARCHGYGNVSFERPPDSGYWFSERCACARGRHLAALDAERRAKTA